MYRIEYFDDVILPLALPEDDLSVGSVQSGIVASVGGSFDAHGARTVWPQKRAVQVRGLYTRPGFWIDNVGNFLVDDVGNFLIWTDEEKELADRTDLLKRLIGQKKQLWRRNEWNGARQWLNARMLSLRALRTIKYTDNALLIEAVFESENATWKNQTTQAVAATLASSGTVAISTVNDGMMDVMDAVLTITATGAITALSLVGMGSSWAITKTMSTGQVLVFDFGAPSIELAGVASYVGFALNAAHTARNWLVISPGYNLWYLTANGPCTIDLEFYPQWP